MSYMVEVQADSTSTWRSNAVRLATAEEAEAYGRDLYSRWVLVRGKRVVESSDPVTYTFVDGQLTAVDAPLTMLDVIRRGVS